MAGKLAQYLGTYDWSEAAIEQATQAYNSFLSARANAAESNGNGESAKDISPPPTPSDKTVPGIAKENGS